VDARSAAEAAMTSSQKPLSNTADVMFLRVVDLSAALQVVKWMNAALSPQSNILKQQLTIMLSVPFPSQVVKWMDAALQKRPLRYAAKFSHHIYP
jgi:hypothetical protein